MQYVKGRGEKIKTTVLGEREAEGGTGGERKRGGKNMCLNRSYRGLFPPGRGEWGGKKVPEPLES